MLDRGETRRSSNNNLSLLHQHLHFFSPADFDRKHVNVIWEWSIFFAKLWLKVNAAPFMVIFFLSGQQ